MPLRITPSVAEQEGQQTETEATGAPQKHHYTLNQQVGSITKNVWYNKNIINKIECCSVDNLQSLLSIIAAKMKSMIYQK
ncbi:MULTISPECIES: hypothetical protein [Enterobacterales]|uniref:Uncharacterized protein n=11 Tax=Enterobacterales TaxID=91347 RepID=A0A0E3DRU0_ECOLX|nr:MULTISPECIES: hypothetical protein [Enterobacterales]RYH56547.1 hypothetical protein EVY07_19965 [Enterobacter hormaechei]AIM48178.1 hypothetical protein [Escherichia coli]AIM48381.1 hypothetical protein [Providencia stuartii]MBQ0532711.1 hypothetical protein [Providencia rettgeri]MCX9969751.1 hypothetical protein [Escherichia coli]